MPVCSKEVSCEEPGQNSFMPVFFKDHWKEAVLIALQKWEDASKVGWNI